MTTEIIVTVCILLLIAYIFDLTAGKTKIPAVILLLALGWGVREISTFVGIKIPDLTNLLPVLGTLGLILIVLEGSLELEFNRSKTRLILKSLFLSIVPLFVLAFALAYLFQYYSGAPLKDCLTNAIPFCVISSSIAIPTVKTLSRFHKEFVIYESSLSDIVGVLFFNFVMFNTSFGVETFGHFGLQILIIIVFSLIATLALAFLLNKIDHHIKFAPIILLVILIYEGSKIFNLPGLIFILLFGLFLGNIDELRQFKWIEKFKPDSLIKEVQKFRELITEAAFLIRALFFLLFGYLLKTSEIINPKTLIWAVGIVLAIFIIRAILLKVAKLPLLPLLFIAPRGLITILLFFAIDPLKQIDLVNNSLIVQVILLSALIMMFGLMSNALSIFYTNKPKENKDSAIPKLE